MFYQNAVNIRNVRRKKFLILNLAVPALRTEKLCIFLYPVNALSYFSEPKDGRIY